MTRPSPVVAQGFSNVGHSYSHILTILYPTVVIALEKTWGASYGELLALMLAGQVLFGLAALPAGWLGDRWSMIGMMVAFFIGTGFAGILTGLANDQFEIALGLALIGLFASIYHPVGMAWLVRNATNRGKALGFNGIFGTFGLALGPLIAGALTDLISWRAAFIVPGATCVAVGIALFALWRMGYVADTHVDIRPTPAPTRSHAVRAFFVLSLTMLCVGVIGQTLTFVMPKLFADKAQSITGGGALGAGTLVTIVYLCAGMSQYVGGHLADRFSMKRIYIIGFAIQAPILLLAAVLENWPLLFVATAMVFINTASVPAENGLLALYTPAKWRGTAYGAKFVLALGVSALAIPLVAVLYDGTGGFFWLFVLLGALATIVAIAGALLPSERRGSSRDLTVAVEPAE
ncbi:MAG TPA: MFS transporter [Alphaproteobacteria bacterium]|nr:MFS transporter [Alphaproteobacteria bacterium]